MTDAMLPYSLAGLFNGPVRVVYAPISATVADKIQSVMAMQSPYGLVSPYVDFGAAKSSASYSRGITKEGAQIQQESGDVLEDITEIPRKLKLSVAELSAENLMILENASEIETIAAATATGAQKSIGLDSFEELTEYRVAFIGVRKKKSVQVVESTGLKRGGLLALIANRVTISADDTTIEFDKGNLAEAPLTFDLHPEPGLTEEVYGRWLVEAAGTLT